MKVLLLGHGSAGTRHARNLRRLMPDVKLGIYDPPLGYEDNISEVDAAVISSPTSMHEANMQSMGMRGIPFMVEKPLGTLNVSSTWDRCAVNHQYRFHPAMPEIRRAAEADNVLGFFARDNLLTRYGPNVAGIMASHAIDLALWLYGPALRVELESDGVKLRGHIQHERGASLYDYRMDATSRESYVTSHVTAIPLPADEGMYIECLRAWLGWVQGGSRDERTATLADGLAVERVLASARVTV